jgi:hypothetical protein
VTHPSLGRPPRDVFRGHPEAAARIRASVEPLSVRALEIALDRRPVMRDRLGEVGLRTLLADSPALIDRVAEAMASDNPAVASELVTWIAPIYRRRKIAMDDLIAVLEGIRAAVGASLDETELGALDRTVDAMVERARWNRRIAGDARPRNKLLRFLYKGA